MPRLSASLLAADFARLGEQVKEVQEAGVDWLHLDVMDGRFVPNFSMGPQVVEAVRRVTDLPLHVHLMVDEPGRWVEPFVQAGADWVGVHAEAARHLHRVVERIREAGAHPTVALNPATPLTVLDHLLDDLDMVLVMTVDPGFGGQDFLKTMIPKIRACRQRLDERDATIHLGVDGGVNEKTLDAALQAGADVLVAGSAIFGADDPGEAVRALKRRFPA